MISASFIGRYHTFAFYFDQMDKKDLLQKLNAMCANTLMETLQIRYTDINTDEKWVKAEMPVNSRVHQPMGLLHGGASAALAESLGSAASTLFINIKENAILGIELSCNHLKSKRDGVISATAKALHLGRSTHLWEIRIEDENGNLISHCKLTNIIVPVKNKF